MRHTLWSSSVSSSLRVDTQMSSIHRLRCMLDRKHVTWYNTQGPLDRCQWMRNTLRESHLQRPCSGIREESAITRDTHTLS